MVPTIHFRISAFVSANPICRSALLEVRLCYEIGQVDFLGFADYTRYGFGLFVCKTDGP